MSKIIMSSRDWENPTNIEALKQVAVPEPLPQADKDPAAADWPILGPTRGSQPPVESGLSPSTDSIIFPSYLTATALLLTI